MWSQHGARISTKDHIRNIGTINEVYQVVTDPTDGIIDVLAAPSLPQRDQVWSQAPNSALLVTDRAPTQASPVLWYVRITYEGELGTLGISDSPLSERPKKQWSNQVRELPVDEDINGVPILTATGEPIEGVTKDFSDIVLNVRRNYATVDIPATQAYLDATNSDTFADFSPGRARLTKFVANEKISKSLPQGYYEVNATIVFRYPYRTTPERAWWKRYRHQGMYVKDETTGSVRRAFDCMNKQERTRPVLLKEDGTEQPDPTQAYWIEFQVYDSLPLNALGIL